MSKLDDILFDPQRYFIQDPDTGHFVEYDVNAGNQLMKPELKNFMLELIGEDEPHKAGCNPEYVCECGAFDMNKLRVELHKKVAEL